MLPGPEDITIDPDTGWAYISSLDRSGGEADPSVRGGIFGLDLGRADLHPVELSSDFPASLPFHPHGISLYRDPAQRMKRLFVINHRAQGDEAIEIFDAARGHLQYRRSIHGSPLLTFPNDIAAIGPEQFYVTNTFHYSSAFMRMIELVPGFGRGNVVYCDGTGDGSFTVVADPVPGANGIAVDKDRTLLYVAACFDRKVLAYPWNPNTPAGQLRRPKEISLGRLPDNIEIDADGSLWIGTDPSLLSLVLYTGRITKTAPSEVVHVRTAADGEPQIDTVYRDSGSTLSASSVAAVYRAPGKQQLLIGAPFDNHLLVCDLKAVAAA